MGPLNYFHESTLPRIHQIVWCRLPAPDGSPGGTVRPALVRGTKRHPPTGRGAVIVSFGTTKLDTVNRAPVDLVIQNNRRLMDLALPQAVRFDLDHEVQLPWAREFFSPPEHSTFVVAGALTEREVGSLRQRLHKRGKLLTL